MALVGQLVMDIEGISATTAIRIKARPAEGMRGPGAIPEPNLGWGAAQKCTLWRNSMHGSLAATAHRCSDWW